MNPSAALCALSLVCLLNASPTASSSHLLAEQITTELRGLNDLGFSLAPGAVTCWAGEAQQGTDYQNLEKTSDAVKATAHTLAVNVVHLAQRLEDHPYPAS